MGTRAWLPIAFVLLLWRPAGALQLTPIGRSADTVATHGRLELTFDAAGSFDNPFDPGEIEVKGRFVSPAGRAVTAPGFYYQPYREIEPALPDRTPLLTPAGPACWKVRFSPPASGTWRYQVIARDRTGVARSAWGSFRAVPGKDGGFVWVAPGGRYFRLDSGAPFFAVGQNVQQDWSNFRHLQLLADNGCNAARVWLCHWFWLEWTPPAEPPAWCPPGHYLRAYEGAGRYNQQVAWLVDQTLDRSAAAGLYLMVCFGHSAELSPGELSPYDDWRGSPYNAANGGPLATPQDFWTSVAARRLYRQRLRYIVARWGYSSHIWAWELWNEQGAATPAMVAWHREMADYLHRLDPNRHLVTTSTWTSEPSAFDAVWRLPQLDFTQTHNYLRPESIRLRTQAALAAYPRPHIVGEAGGPAPSGGESATPDTVDPAGIDFHNCLWSAALAGAAGGALPWWWRGRIEPNRLGYHYRALANFARQVDWPAAGLRPLAMGAVSVSPRAGARRYSPVLIEPLTSGWGGRPAQSRFTVAADGTVAGLENLPQFIFGQWRPELHNPPTLVLNCPVAGRLIVYLAETSQSVLAVTVDGRQVRRDESLDTPRRLVNRQIPIELPAGRHEVTLDNLGGDWLRIEHLLLTAYRDTARYPDLQVYGLVADREALLWLHNRANEWPCHAAGIEPQTVKGARLTLRGLPAGRYRVEWWDTYAGRRTAVSRAVGTGKTLSLAVPPVERDIACRVVRVKGAGSGRAAGRPVTVR